MSKKYDWKQITDFCEKNPQLSKKDIAEKYKCPPETLTRGLKSFYAKLNEDIMLKKFAKQQIGIDKQKKILMYKNQIINKNLREYGFIENILEGLHFPKFKNKFEVTKKEHTGKKFFLVGDLHYKDENTSKYIKQIPNLILNNCDSNEDIVIILGGDFIENTMHNSQLLVRTKAALEQTVEVSSLLGEVFKFIGENHSGDIDIYGLVGNHDEIRQLNFKANEDRKENVTPIIFQFLKTDLRDYKNIIIHSFQYELLFKKEKLHFRHGHLLGYGTNLDSKILKERSQQFNKFQKIETYIFFHFHKFKIEQIKGTNIRLIWAPAMKDWNDNFEYDNNLVNTYGILLIQGDTFKLVK
jgi:hypothetical protein